ncbi:MAG: acyl-CoA dehydrogenase, partial [Gammaproteobacteria bacterium]|nr:acyl-CoA dehydrogenase [Gammaproteobacteria bacterium]
EAGTFARDILAPLNIPGDNAGCRVVDRQVEVADGFADAYRQFVENGWPSLSGTPAFGGMGLPHTVGLAAFEMWNSANMAFSLCPMLTGGAVSAIETHATDELKDIFLPKMVSGEWSGTMVLTEPHAGSDLAALTTKAVRDGDRYRLFGTKIYITWGDHPMAENTIHLVLARLEDAPDGIRGISMFLVPKFLVNTDGSLGDRNDVFPASVEHKLGIHASPTCVLSFGDTTGAIGYLVGEENRGMANMFTMMNQARLEVGVQGLALSERAYQLARAYARDRVQGVAPGHEGRVTIIHHADVRRMLLMMKSQIEAMRGAAYCMCGDVDRSHHAADTGEREAAVARAALLTPIIKGWLSEVAQELTSLGIQIHGGMGFVEETGAAQHLRDARILPIYEGTTGIQAADFVGRKIMADEGRAMKALLADMRQIVVALQDASLEPLHTALAENVHQLEAGIDWLVSEAIKDQDLPGAASVNLLMAAGVSLGTWQLARSALAVTSDSKNYDEAFRESKIVTASFYAEQVSPRVLMYVRAAMAGPDSVMALNEEQF